MKHRSTIFIIAISAAGLFSILPVHTLTSCGPNLMSDESRLALFRTQLDGKSGYRPFNYGENLFARTDADPKKTDQQVNSMEWVAFSDNHVRKEDVFQIQCKTTPDSFLTAYNTHNWQSFAGNTFISWLQKKENKASLDYMFLAKKNEAAFHPSNDPWDTIPIKKPSMEMLTSRESVDAVTKDLPVFLKERYAFQAVKLLYYGAPGGNYNQLYEIYDKYLNKKKTIVAGWAMLYYAMTLKDRDQRTSMLLNAFDASEEKKAACYQAISRDDLASLERKTTDIKTLILLNTFKAIKNKEQSLKQINTVYQADHKSKYLPLLITREVNKLENWIWSGDILGFYANYRAEDDSITGVRDYKKTRMRDLCYLGEFSNWINHLDEHNTFLSLVKIHLLNMQKKFAEAQKQLEKLPRALNNNMELQRQIEKMIILSQSNTIGMASTKEEITGCINKMMTLDTIFRFHLKHGFELEYDHDKGSENEDDLAELLMLLSNSYKKTGDMVTASLLFNKTHITVNAYGSYSYYEEENYYNTIAFLDRFGSPEDIDRLLQLKHATKITSFEKLIIPLKWASDDTYKELKGTILIREKKYSEAMEVFNKMRPTFWNDNYQFKDNLPGYSVTNTGSLIPGEKSKPKEYTYVSKKLILEDIINLEGKINSVTNDQVKAILFYKLANCYFNISYHGKAWMMFSYGRWADEAEENKYSNYNWAAYNFYPNSKKYHKDYYECSSAIDSYKKALNLTKDKELAAKCLLALNYCTNAVANFHIGIYSKQKNSNVSYLKLLSTKYANTYNFKEAAQLCPDVIEYLSNKK